MPISHEELEEYRKTHPVPATEEENPVTEEVSPVTEEQLQTLKTLKEKYGAEAVEAGLEELGVDSVTLTVDKKIVRSEQSESVLWYVVSFLFGILGGILGYVALRFTDRRMATNCLIIGFATTVIGGILGLVLLSALGMFK